MIIEERTYVLDQSITFMKTKEKFGPFSNMCAGFPFKVNDIIIPTAEALYQALKFPHIPELQHSIINAKSPMTAKIIAGQRDKDKVANWIDNSHGDVHSPNVVIMQFCVVAKMFTHIEFFTGLLKETGILPIVEISYKDKFWGAIPFGREYARGCNVLGRTWMWLRESMYDEKWHRPISVELEINDQEYLLYGEPIRPVVVWHPDPSLNNT